MVLFANKPQFFANLIIGGYENDFPKDFLLRVKTFPALFGRDIINLVIRGKIFFLTAVLVWRGTDDRLKITVKSGRYGITHPEADLLYGKIRLP